MSNVIDFNRPSSADSENELDTVEERAHGFEAEMKANKERKERLAKERVKHNKKTFRDYKIKPKGEIT